VGRALLVAHEDVMDLGPVQHFVVKGEDDTSRVSEDRSNSMIDQGLHDNLGAGTLLWFFTHRFGSCLLPVAPLPLAKKKPFLAFQEGLSSFFVVRFLVTFL